MRNKKQDEFTLGAQFGCLGVVFVIAIMIAVAICKITGVIG